MKILIFLAITLISGAISGTILAIINQGLVEPYIDSAINIETEITDAFGDAVLNLTVNSMLDVYRMYHSQKKYQVKKVSLMT